MCSPVCNLAPIKQSSHNSAFKKWTKAFLFHYYKPWSKISASPSHSWYTKTRSSFVFQPGDRTNLVWIDESLICINAKRPGITYHQGRFSVGLTWSHANIVILGRPSKWTPIQQLLFVAQWTSVSLPKSNVGVQLLDLWLTNSGISTWRNHCTYTSLLQLIMRAAYMDTHLEIQGSMTTVTDITHKYINYPVTVKLNVAETPKWTCVVIIARVRITYKCLFFLI
jgi:hypothetical protein